MNTCVDVEADAFSFPDLTTATDLAYKQAIASRDGPYIMAVSPWQFKNINGEAWVENSDYLWKYRWEQAINGKFNLYYS